MKIGVAIDFFSSDAALERGATEQLTLGPFDFVQATYTLIRTGEEQGEANAWGELAEIRDGDWHIVAGPHAGTWFSDFSVYPVPWETPRA
jgi:hypothetical protein